MRRLMTLVGALLVGSAVTATPALATFHLEKVNEVMLASGTGDTSVQFVELLDKGGTEEQFTPVFAPYKLVIYDGAGNKLGEHMLDPAGLRAAASGTPYLVSTAAADAAFGVKGDERLDVSLPTSAGQACFEANPNPPAFSCVTWGAVTKPVPTNSMGTGSAHGPLPPNGESDQRQADDSIVAAPPTPKAQNRGATTPATPPAAFAGAVVIGHRAKVDARGRARMRLSCPAGTSGSCKVRLTLNAARRGARLGRASIEIAPGKQATVLVVLSRSARRQLRSHRTLTARASVTAHDGAGSTKSTSFRLTLVRSG